MVGLLLGHPMGLALPRRMHVLSDIMGHVTFGWSYFVLHVDKIIDDKPPDVKTGWFTKEWMYQTRALTQASARHVCNGVCVLSLQD